MIVAGADPLPRAAFDQHAMAVRGEFAGAFRRQADAIFMIFNLARTADDHGENSLALALADGGQLTVK